MLNKILRVFCAIFCITFNLNSQCTTFHSTHTEDQEIQGPCYVFATTAALESVSNENIDLSEWYFWSTCVLDGATGYGPHIINSIADHVNDIGALYEEDFYDPFGPDGQGCINGQGNPSGSNTPCIFICEGAENDFCEATNQAGCPIGLQISEEAGTCNFGGYTWMTHFPTSFRSGNVSLIDLNIGNLSSDDKEELLEQTICDDNQGVVLFLNDYRPNGNSDNVTSHAVYAFKKNGSSFTYKDSWPGDPSSGRTQSLDFEKISHAYFFEGSLNDQSCIDTPEPDCDCQLVGPSSTVGQATFKLVGPCKGAKDWNVSDNLEVTSGGSRRSRNITVALDSCQVENVNVSVQVGECDPMSVSFVLDPKPAAPVGITVFAQQICPNQIIELNVEDDNAATPEVSYEWQVVSGGALASGQGSGTIFVTTSGAEFGVLNVRVRARNECGVSDWFTISIPFDRDCRDGDGGLRSVVDDEVSIFPNPAFQVINIDGLGSQVYSELLSLDGKVVSVNQTSKIDVAHINSGIYILRIKKTDGHRQSFKLIIN